MKQILNENYYSVQEMAEMLGLAQNTIRLYCSTGKIISAKFGKNWYASENNFKTYLNNQHNKVNTNE